MILQRPIHPFDEDVSLPALVEEEVTRMATVRKNSTSENIGTAELEIRFDVVHFPHQYLLFKASHINDPKIPLFMFSLLHNFCKRMDFIM